MSITSPKPLLFTSELLKNTIPENNTENHVSSPVASFILLLSFLSTKAIKHETASQVKTTLGLKGTQEHELATEANDVYKRYLQPMTTVVSEIDGQKKPVLLISNGLFLSKKHSIRPEFIASMMSTYKAKVRTVDFSQPEQAVTEINRWSFSATKGLVPQIFKSSKDIDPYTEVVIVNAISFRDNWRHPFNQKETSNEVFQVHGQQITVPMMSIIETMPYARSDELGISVVKKKLKNTRFSVLFIRSNEESNFESAVDILRGPKKLKSLLSSTTDTTVLFKVPKFHIGDEIDLVKPLKQMGIRDLFDETKADLSGISKVGLYVSIFKQASTLRVDENGIEASAVTAIVIQNRAMIYPEVDFFLDRPFVVSIYDEKNEMPLFAAVVMRP